MVQRFLIAAIDVYVIVLVVRIVFTWLPTQARGNQFHEFLEAVTEPVMRPFRRLVPPLGGVDFSPILLFLLLAAARHVLARL
jgi:YggT family protein